MSADLIKRLRDALSEEAALEAGFFAAGFGNDDKCVQRYNALIAEADAWLASGGKQEPVGAVADEIKKWERLVLGYVESLVRHAENGLRIESDFNDVAAMLRKHPLCTDLKPQESGGWVPVSERLPDQNGASIWCHYRHGGISKANWSNYTTQAVVNAAGVTHWRYAEQTPAPPKEGGKS